MKAKKTPTKYITPEKEIIYIDRCLNFLQAIAASLSKGHGAFLLSQWSIAERLIKTPAPPNTHTLCSDRVIRIGKLPSNPTNDAPIPIVTSRAGRAQHRRVPRLVNNPIIGTKLFRQKFCIILQLHRE